MGALPNTPIADPRRKPPAKAGTPKLDKYGRDPSSLTEQLRSQSDFEKQTGYSPLYKAALYDMFRLASGQTCLAFLLVLNDLSLGRQRSGPKDRFEEWTLPISAADLAERSRASVRDIQRHIVYLEERGIAAVKTVKNGGGSVKYAISLLFSMWRPLEDYDVWKRRQIVATDEAPESPADLEDEDQTPVSKDAVQLFKRPVTARPGRATRAVRVSVGVREIVCQNDSPSVDTTYSAVVQSGRLVVTSRTEKGETKAKGEDKANDTGVECSKTYNTERVALKPIECTNQHQISHPRAADIIAVFDPALKRWNSPLISVGEEKMLWAACAELGEMPLEFLDFYVNNPKGRGKRSISGPRAVVAIIRQARLNWEARKKDIESEQARSVCRKCRKNEITYANGVNAGLCWECGT